MNSFFSPELVSPHRFRNKGGSPECDTQAHAGKPFA